MDEAKAGNISEISLLKFRMPVVLIGNFLYKRLFVRFGEPTLFIN